MKKLIYLILIFASCSQKYNSEEITDQSQSVDSVSFTFSNSTYNLTDTFVRHADGNEMTFRKLIIENHLNQSIYLDRTHTGILWTGGQDIYFDQKSKTWVSDGISCGPLINGYFTINSKSIDTIEIGDPFRLHDTIEYGFGYRLDSSSFDKYNYVVDYYYQTKEKKINYYR